MNVFCMLVCHIHRLTKLNFETRMVSRQVYIDKPFRKITRVCSSAARKIKISIRTIILEGTTLICSILANENDLTPEKYEWDCYFSPTLVRGWELETLCIWKHNTKYQGSMTSSHVRRSTPSRPQSTHPSIGVRLHSIIVLAPLHFSRKRQPNIKT